MQLISILATYGTLLEMLLILILILSIFLFKIVNYYRTKNMLALISKIEKFLLKKVKLNQQIVAKTFKKNWGDLKILLAIIEKFDKKLEGNNWIQIRANFIRNVILPLARKATLSRKWKIRHAAALAFTLYSENNDEQYILALLNDSIPLVRYSAASAGIVYGSEPAIKLIITQMAKENWLTQTIYMHGFDKVPFGTYYFLERLMQTTQEANLRATSYNILLRYPIFEVNWQINQDIYSTSEKLSLSAIRYLTYNQKALALPTLLSLLEKPNWKVRALVISCLSDLKITPAVPLIKPHLHDQNWWVRLAASEALKNLDITGDNVLYLQDVNANIGEHLLNTLLRE